MMRRSGLTAADLLKDLDDQDAAILLGSTEEDERINRAIFDAELWVVATLRKYGKAAVWSDEVVATAVRKRSAYELYSLTGNGDRARDKRDDAAQLLRSLYALPSDSAPASRKAAACVVTVEEK